VSERTIDTLDFATSLAELRDGGARLLTIRPADDPAEALLETSDGDRVRLRRTPVALSRGDDRHGWHTGRAGMHYRDLIPDRWDGRFVASHIAVPAGGEVPTTSISIMCASSSLRSVAVGCVWSMRIRAIPS